MKSLGGNKINTIDRNKKKVSVGKSKYYFYNYYNLHKNQKINLHNNLNCTLYVLNSAKNSFLKIGEKKIKILNNMCLYFTKYKKIEILNGKLLILLIGKKRRNITNFYLKKKYSNFYKVTKPWGYELWINSLKDDFAFKKIYIKKNFQTSLQFHKFKRETNFIFNGKASLIYKKNKRIKNMKVTPNDLSSKVLQKNTVINIFPNKLHRIKAINNLTLYEVSSPHLKDVIRVKDDSERLSGHLKSEHPINK